MRDRQSDSDDRDARIDRSDSAAAEGLLPNRNTPTRSNSQSHLAAARCLLVGSLLGLSWLGMQGLHEAGHILAAQLTGGTVTRVAWHPLTISQTEVRPNPRPLTVAWGGPLVGLCAPLVLWLSTRLATPSIAYLLQFFAGFCCVANGAYLAVGTLSNVGDPAVLLRLGAPGWSLVALGTIAAAFGLGLWNGLGPHFGSDGKGVKRRHAVGVSALFGVTVVALLLLNWR